MLWEFFISGILLSVIILLPVGIKWEINKRVIMPFALLIGILSGAVVKGITEFWNFQFYH